MDRLAAHPVPTEAVRKLSHFEAPAVILHELNEVPWEVIDCYIARKANSHISHILQRGQSLTTVTAEPGPFAPWRTWPSFHTSRPTTDHHSVDLGQDPSTFDGETLWDAAERAGLKVGVFGPLQSWPARSFKNGGFYVPDTFSRDAVTDPP